MAFHRAGLRGEKLAKAVQGTQMAKAKGAAMGFSMAFEPSYVEAARTGTIPESTFGKAMLGLETATDLIPGVKVLKGLAAGAAMAGTIYKAGKPVQRTISPQQSKNARKAIQNVRNEYVNRVSSSVDATKRVEDFHGGPFPSGMTFRQYDDLGGSDEFANIQDAKFFNSHLEGSKELAGLYTSMYNPQASHQNLRDFKANVIRGLRERNVPNEIVRSHTTHQVVRRPEKPMSGSQGSITMRMKHANNKYEGSLSDKDLFQHVYDKDRNIYFDFNDDDLRKLKEAEDAFRRGDLGARDMFNAQEALSNARLRRQEFDISEEFRRSQIARRAVQARRMQHRTDMTRGYGFKYGKNVHPDVTRRISGD